MSKKKMSKKKMSAFTVSVEVDQEKMTAEQTSKMWNGVAAILSAVLPPKAQKKFVAEMQARAAELKRDPTSKPRAIKISG